MIAGLRARARRSRSATLAAADHSSLRGQALLPILETRSRHLPKRRVRYGRLPFARRCPPARPRAPRCHASPRSMRSSARTSATTSPPRRSRPMGVIAAATGDTASKYVARRETPLYIPENCTQCMECISVCPDTALPNTSQDLSTLLAHGRHALRRRPGRARARCSPSCRRSRSSPAQRMVAEIKTGTPLPTILREVTESVDGFSAEAKAAVLRHHRQGADGLPEGERHLLVAGAQGARLRRHLLHLCHRSVQGLRGLRHGLRRPQRAEDGCRKPRRSTPSTKPAPPSSTCCPTPRRSILGLYNAANPADSKTATLRNMLMVRTNYDALVSGDGACAGCGEKSVLRSIAAVTEAYMRPVYHAKSDRFVAKAGELEKNGVATSGSAQGSATRRNTSCFARPSRTSSWASAAKTTTDTKARIAAYESKHGPITDAQLVEAIAAVLLHRGLQPQEPAAHRRPPRQRHERHGHGRAHRLQHRLRLHRAQQSAPLSVDELALPGRRHRGLAHGRELHRRSRPPLRHSRAPGRHPPHPRRQTSSTPKSTTTSRTSPTR